MKKCVFAFIFYLVASLTLTYPLIRHLDRAVYTSSDSLHSAWILDQNVYTLSHRPLKEFFNANTFYPYQNTLAYSDHLLGQTILAAPVIYLTDNPILAQNILILFSFALSGFAAFLLVDYWLKNKPAALVAGFAFAFSNFRFQQLDHLNILSCQWIPLIFLYLQKWLGDSKKKHLLLFGIFYLLTILNNIHFAIMTSFALISYLFFYLLFLKPKTFPFAKALSLFLTFLICFLIYFPTLLPYLKFKQEFFQIGRTIRDNLAGSTSLASLFFTASSTRIARIAWFDNLSEADAGLFPGIVFLILFWLGITKIEEKRQRRFLLSLVILFFIFSFGPILRFSHQNDTSLPLPYLLFYLLLPPFKAMRTPVRWCLFAHLFACFFIAYGVKFLINKNPRAKTFLVVLIVFLISLESFSVPLDLILIPPKKEFPEVYQWLNKQPEDFVILELPIPQITDLSLFQNKKIPYHFLKNLTPREYDTVETYRIYFSTLHHKKLVNGYAAFFPPIYLEVVEKSQNFNSKKFFAILKQLKVKYVIIHKEQLTEEQKAKDFPAFLKDEGFALIKEFRGQDYVFTFKN